MKAMLSVDPGGPDSLALMEVPEPALRKGGLLVRVEACAINYPDVLIIEDKYQIKPARPFAPGGEIAGIVEAVGAGVEGWQIGDRIIAVIGYGGLAQRVVLDASRAYRLPEKITADRGAALLLTYATALHALTDRGHIRQGDTLLVLGAAGGVGLAAAEVGKLLGARVIAAVSSEEKAAAAREIGVDGVLIYPRDAAGTSAKDLAAMFKSAVGEAGANVIVDPVGGDYAEPALRAIAWEGRYLVLGFPAGIPKLPLNLPLLKSCDICGVYWGAFALREPQRARAEVDQLLQWLENGQIAPRISKIWPLEKAAEAISHMASRQAIGKLIVTVPMAGPAN